MAMRWFGRRAPREGMGAPEGVAEVKVAPVAAVVEAKASAAGKVMAAQGAGRALWGARDMGALTRGGFVGNPHRGEVAVVLDGRRHVARLTLGALAALEADLGEDSLLGVIERFENGRFSSRDVIAVLVAGLRGGG